MGVINLAEIQQQFPNIQNLTPLAVASGQKVVFSGTHNGKKVALKLFKFGSDQRRVEREIQAVATLSSNYVPAVHEHGQETLGGARDSGGRRAELGQRSRRA